MIPWSLSSWSGTWIHQSSINLSIRVRSGKRSHGLGFLKKEVLQIIRAKYVLVLFFFQSFRYIEKYTDGYKLLMRYTTSCMVRFDGTTLLMGDILFTVSDDDVWQEGQEYLFTLQGTGGHYILKSHIWNTQWSDCLLTMFDSRLSLARWDSVYIIPLYLRWT